MRYTIIDIYKKGKQLRYEETDDFEEAKEWAKYSEDRHIIETNVFDTEKIEVVYSYQHEYEKSESYDYENDSDYIRVRSVCYKG